MSASCAYCRDPVDAPAACPTCRTLLHAECVAEVDACPTLGCAGRLEGMRPARPAAPTGKGDPPDERAVVHERGQASRADPHARGRRLFLAALLGGGLAAVLAWAGWLPRNPLRARPAVPGTLLVAGFEGCPPEVLEQVAAGVRREYGCAVEVVALRLPVPAGRPLLAEELIALARRLERTAALGVLGVTGHELRARGSRFVLGLADGRVAVLSYGRAEEDPDPAGRERRLVGQALSSVAWLLGLPRCDRSSCALASFDDVLGSDLRGAELCGACAARAAAWRP